MAHNPPRYFPPHYFDAGYWGGEQVEGSISASLSGSGDIDAALAFTQTQAKRGGGRKRRSDYAYLNPKPVQAKPVFIEAKIGGAGIVTAGASATAEIAASLAGQSHASAGVSASANLGADISGSADLRGAGFTVDNWAQAREEEEFWLLAA